MQMDTNREAIGDKCSQNSAKNSNNNATTVANDNGENKNNSDVDASSLSGSITIMKENSVDNDSDTNIQQKINEQVEVS